MLWDACTQDPHALVRLIECHPASAAWAQVVGTVGAILGAFLVANGQAAREAFPPFLSHLQDIQRMLSVDLSQSGVAAATPIANKTVDEGKSIIGSLDTMISALTELKAQISPTGK